MMKESISLYNTVRKEVNDIQIVEINETGCDYQDFVLFYYPVEKESLKAVKKLINQYKKENTVCLIGVSSYIAGCDEEPDDILNDPHLLKLFNRITPEFDLSFDFLEIEDFEELVNSCVSCRNGVIHGDPQDYVNFGKDTSSLFLYADESETIEETSTKIVQKIEQDYVHNDEDKITKMIITIICDENLLMADLNKAITIIKSTAIDNCDITWNICYPTVNSNKQTCKIVLISN